MLISLVSSLPTECSSQYIPPQREHDAAPSAMQITHRLDLSRNVLISTCFDLSHLGFLHVPTPL